MTPATPPMPDQDLQALAARLDAGGGVDLVDEALASHPHDPRLHFLRGSILASDRDYEAARAAVGEAVRLAPDYAIARFQLGFLEYTSGEPGLAAVTWQPLLSGPSTDPLRLFAEGLLCLPVDDVSGALVRLNEGLSLNQAYPPLNRDMQLIINELSGLAGAEAPDASADQEATSETDFLLRQFGPNTRH